MWLQITQRAPSLNRNPSSNIWWLINGNQRKFINEYLMWTEKQVLVKKYTNGLNMALLLRVWFEKQSMELKYTYSVVKELFRMSWFLKRIIRTVFWDIKWPIAIGFLGKCAIINSAFYWHFLRQNLPYLLYDIRILVRKNVLRSKTQYVNIHNIWEYITINHSQVNNYFMSDTNILKQENVCIQVFKGYIYWRMFVFVIFISHTEKQGVQVNTY